MTSVLLPSIILALGCTAIGTLALWRPYELPKEMVAVLGGIGISLWWVLLGSGQVALPPFVGELAAVMFIYWAIRGLFTKFPRRSLYEASLYIGSFVVALSCEFRTGVICLVCAGIINCLYGLVQNILRYELLKGTTNEHKLYAIGFIGNENMLGNWLVPVVFLNLWLVAESVLWVLPLPLFVYVLGKTHCKTALFGLVCGGVWVFVMLNNPVGLVIFIGVVILALVLVGKIFIRSPNTLQERLNYWRVAWKQITKKPLFGLGFGEFQNRVCHVQAEINDETKGKFLARSNYQDPWPRRCHNDAIQHWLDHGVVGLALWLGLIVLGFYYGAHDGWRGVCVMAAMVGVLTCGMGLHCFFLMPTNFVFWFCLVSLWKLYPGVYTIHVVSPLVVYIACTVALLLLLDVFRFESLFQRFLRFKTEQSIVDVITRYPHSAVAHDYASLFYASKANPVAIVKHAALAIAHYDGINRLWEAYANLGSGLILLGAFGLAEQCINKALHLWPAFERGKTAKAELDSLLRQIQCKVGVVIHDEPNRTASQTSDKRRTGSQQVGGVIHTPQEFIQQG